MRRGNLKRLTAGASLLAAVVCVLTTATRPVHAGSTESSLAALVEPDANSAISVSPFTWVLSAAHEQACFPGSDAIAWPMIGMFGVDQSARSQSPLVVHAFD